MTVTRSIGRFTGPASTVLDDAEWTSEYFLCRNRSRGCHQFWRFDPAERPAAERDRREHEKECPHRP